MVESVVSALLITDGSYLPRLDANADGGKPGLPSSDIEESRDVMNEVDKAESP